MKTKEELLKEIERLLAYNPEQKLEINPNYLEYLEVKDLESIKANLLNRVGRLKEEDKDWIKQFKSYE